MLGATFTTPVFDGAKVKGIKDQLQKAHEIRPAGPGVDVKVERYDPSTGTMVETAIPDGKAVRVMREKNGRGGKVVTVVRGLPLADEALATLLKELKGKLGGGGTVKEGDLELQGDHRDRLVALLNERGFKAKAAGG